MVQTYQIPSELPLVRLEVKLRGKPSQGAICLPFFGRSTRRASPSRAVNLALPILAVISTEKTTTPSLPLLVWLQCTHRRDSRVLRNPVTADLENLDSSLFYVLQVYNPSDLALSVGDVPSALHTSAPLPVSGGSSGFLAGCAVHASHTDSWPPG